MYVYEHLCVQHTHSPVCSSDVIPTHTSSVAAAPSAPGVLSYLTLQSADID